MAENPRELGSLAEGAPKDLLGEFVEARKLRELEKVEIAGKRFVPEEEREWDGEEVAVELEGPRTEKERQGVGRFAGKEPIFEFVKWERSPQLEAKQ